MKTTTVSFTDSQGKPRCVNATRIQPFADNALIELEAEAVTEGGIVLPEVREGKYKGMRPNAGGLGSGWVWARVLRVGPGHPEKYPEPPVSVGDRVVVQYIAGQDVIAGENCSPGTTDAEPGRELRLVRFDEIALVEDP